MTPAASALPPEPLDATLARLAGLNPYLAYSADSRDDGIPVTDLAREGIGQIRAALQGMAAEGAVEPQVQAAWFIHRYSWTLAAPAAGIFHLDRSVPDLSPDNVAVALTDPAAFVQIRLIDSTRSASVAHTSAPCSAGLFPTEAELLAWLRTTLELHLETLLALEPLTCLTRKARRLLAADACAAAFLDVGQELDTDDEAIRSCRAFLAPSGILQAPLDLVPAPDGSSTLTRRRSSCCLAYRVGGLDKCSTCPLRRTR